MKIFSIIIFILITPAAYSQDTLLTVEQAIKMAIQNNYGVIISKNKIEIDRINNSWGNAGALPTLSAVANKSIGSNNIKQVLSNGTETNKNGAATNNINAGVNVNWRVFDGFKMYATKQRLAELERAGELNFTNQVNQTVFDVITGYYNIVRFKQQLKASETQLQLYKERVNIADVKFRIGSAAKNDLLQAQVDLNEQLSGNMSLKNSIATAKADLNNLMGRSPSVPYSVMDTIILKPLPVLSEIQSKIDLQNPQILLAKNNVAVLTQTKREINAQRLPTVTLNGNYNFVKNSSGAGFTLFNQTYGPSASVGVSVPLFTGGVVKNQLRVSDIQIQNQNIAIEQLRNQLTTTLVNAVTTYQNALEIVNLEKQNLQFSAENLFIASERFRKLNITSVELRQVQLSYIAAENRLFDALYLAKQAEVRIGLLTGEIANL
ncbi:TolC family protein [soil metagenome]